MSTQKKSTFQSDLKKEQRLSKLLDRYYGKHLKNYHFERIADLTRQMKGIDLIFTHKATAKTFLVDEKAQLDYVNEDLPTFAFELIYYKHGAVKKGWLFDQTKKTDFYTLVTAIYTDEPDTFTSCKLTFVNREKLISFLGSRNISRKSLESIIALNEENHSKLKLETLHPKKEGYLYFSKHNKAEKPVNLVLKLDFLIKNGMAKRFV
ncbi:hypothetical protein ACEZ3G_06460 [Maribacter algicola]|uniref:Uncharacterized protein n=1 Tax=Meishania litoralis TaxID=3434685 RepID=A0ACC7LHG6_9FLAO